jgi:hypothetical protein
VIEGRIGIFHCDWRSIDSRGRDRYREHSWSRMEATLLHSGRTTARVLQGPTCMISVYTHPPVWLFLFINLLVLFIYFFI